MQEYLFFMCGGEDFALPISVVREVIFMPQITPVPHVPDFVAGLFYLRRHSIAAVNLAIKLKVAPVKSSRIIIVKAKDLIMGLMVDSVSKVFSIEESRIEPAPKIALPINDGYVKTVTNFNNKMVLFLDLEEIFSLEECSSMKT